MISIGKKLTPIQREKKQSYLAAILNIITIGRSYVGSGHMYYDIYRVRADPYFPIITIFFFSSTCYLFILAVRRENTEQLCEFLCYEYYENLNNIIF